MYVNVLNVLRVSTIYLPKNGLSSCPRHQRFTLPPSLLPWPRHWIYRLYGEREWMANGFTVHGFIGFTHANQYQIMYMKGKSEVCAH